MRASVVRFCASAASAEYTGSLMQPGAHQQTLKRSFTVGGLGLHTARYGKMRHSALHTC